MTTARAVRAVPDVFPGCLLGFDSSERVGAGAGCQRVACPLPGTVAAARALCHFGQTVEAIAVHRGHFETLRNEVLLQVIDPGGARDREDDG